MSIAIAFFITTFHAAGFFVCARPTGRGDLFRLRRSVMRLSTKKGQEFLSS